MIRSFDDHVSAVTAAGESTSSTEWVPSLWLVTIIEPPLASGTAVARYLPFGENAAALGDGPSCLDVPPLENCTSAPGTSGAPVTPPSGVAVGLAEGEAG